MRKLPVEIPGSSPEIVHCVAVGLGQWQDLPEPVMSDTIACPICGGKDHAAVFCTLEKDSKRVRICIEANCRSYEWSEGCQATYPLTYPKRELLWPEFCEINGIGDVHHGLIFESVEQAARKIEFMKKWCEKPHSIVHMQGARGTGKTYAAMGMCELFTRRDYSCRFMRQTELRDKWLDKSPDFMQVYSCKLLVIDDFGTGELPPKFMDFFMTLIDKRMQWTDRGTVITTNLSEEQFSEYCGDALADRIHTGQLMEFMGTNSRRKKAI